MLKLWLLTFSLLTLVFDDVGVADVVVLDIDVVSVTVVDAFVRNNCDVDLDVVDFVVIYIYVLDIFVFLLGGVASDWGRRMRARHCSIHARTAVVCSVVRATCEALKKQLLTHFPFRCHLQHMFGIGPLLT